MTAKNTEVAIKNVNENAVALFSGFEDDGLGFDASDFKTPRIVIIGDLSPQLKKNNAKYIAGVEVGDLVDDSTGEILAKGFGEGSFEFLPVYRTKEAIRWKPNRGGLVSRTLLGRGELFEELARKEGLEANAKYEWKYPNDDELVEHWNYFGLDLSRDAMPVFISMKKSNIKVGKVWNRQMQNAKLPNGNTSKVQYSHFYNIGTFMDSGNNNEWPNFTVTKGGFVGEKDGWEQLTQQAKELHEIIASGDYKADIAEDAVAEEGAF